MPVCEVSWSTSSDMVAAPVQEKGYDNILSRPRRPHNGLSIPVGVGVILAWRSLPQFQWQARHKVLYKA
jgi:hypothetical protein